MALGGVAVFHLHGHCKQSGARHIGPGKVSADIRWTDFMAFKNIGQLHLAVLQLLWTIKPG